LYDRPLLGDRKVRTRRLGQTNGLQLVRLRRGNGELYNNIHSYRLITFERTASEKLELMASRRLTGQHLPAAATTAVAAAAADAESAITLQMLRKLGLLALPKAESHRLVDYCLLGRMKLGKEMAGEMVLRHC